MSRKITTTARSSLSDFENLPSSNGKQDSATVCCPKYERGNDNYANQVYLDDEEVKKHNPLTIPKLLGWKR